MRYPIDIRVRAMQLRNHKFVTPAINGSSWITNTAPSPDLPMFSWISMRIRRFSERSNFPGTSLRSVIEFYEMWRKIHFNIRERERERERERSSGLWKESNNPIFTLCYELFAYSVDYHQSYLWSIFHWQTVRHMFFKLTEFRAAAESPQHKRVQRTEANPGQLQACSNWIPIWEDTGIPGITSDCFR